MDVAQTAADSGIGHIPGILQKAEFVPAGKLIQVLFQTVRKIRCDIRIGRKPVFRFHQQPVTEERGKIFL